MVDSTLENVWTSNSTPAIDIPGAPTFLRTTVQGCPNSTGVLVTGALEAEDCEFQDLGEVSLAFRDPRFPNRSSVGNSTFVSDGDVTGDTVGISVRWSSKMTGTVDLTVDGCTFDGFTYGIQAFVNTTKANLSVQRSGFNMCSSGLLVRGNAARANISGCTFYGSATVGIWVYDVEPMQKPLNVTINDVTSSSSSIGVYVRGTSVGFRPLLKNLFITGCDHGIQALGATILVEDSMIIDCGVDFYAESKSRIEVRRTVHTHRSAEIAPAQHAAVVVFGTVDVTSCRWKDAHHIDEGLLYLFGEDGVELERVDLAEPAPVELVIWSLTRYYDLGRYWVVPTYRIDGHEFKGMNLSIYNTSSQDVVMLDHLPPEIPDAWPEDGHWFRDSSIDVSGRLLENGSGLEVLLVRIVGGQELEATVPEDGNWSVTFDPVDDGSLTIEIVATDRTGGTVMHLISDLMVDTVAPEVQLEHSYLEMSNGTLLIPANDLKLQGTPEPHTLVDLLIVGGGHGSQYKCNETVTADGDGRFEAQLCPGPGYHDVAITATDRAGNIFTMTLGIGMDPAPPAIEITDPRPDENRVYTTTQVRVRGNIHDPGLSQWFTVWVDDQEVEVPGGVLDVTVDLEKGEHTIEVRAQDQVGHSSKVTVRVRVDITPPELDIITPDQAEFITEEIKVALQGEVADDNLEALTLNGMPMATVEGVFTSSLIIEEGENVFLIEALDSAGNTAVRRLVITKDLTPPHYTTGVTILDGELMDVDGKMYATTSGDALPKLEIVFTVSEHTIVKASGDLGQAEGEGRVTLTISLQEGENSVTFSLVDLAGNTAPSFTYRVTLDTTPPEIVIQGAGGTVRTKDRTHWLRGRVEPGSDLTVDGNPVKVNADGTFSTQVDLVKGENVFHLEATDLVGLDSSKDFEIIREVEEEESPGPGAVAAMLAMMAMAFMCTRKARRRA